MGSQALLLMFYIQNKDGSFLQEFIYHGHAFLLFDEWGNMNCEQPTFVGGNQIIITSRSIGYYLYPIQLTMLETFTLKVIVIVRE